MCPCVKVSWGKQDTAVTHVLYLVFDPTAWKGLQSAKHSNVVGKVCLPKHQKGPQKGPEVRNFAILSSIQWKNMGVDQ